MTNPEKTMTSVSQLKPFLEPKSIAVVGANPNTGEQAFNVVENLANCGYQGKVYPVNPNYVVHIEGISGDGKKFREAAQRVTKKKPVLALKTGRTERSAPDDAVRALSRLADYSEFRKRFSQ